MNEAWAAIVASIAAGLFALVGAYYGSRRQTTDQADVEHGQWLRGQRQEAYLVLLDAWDNAMRELDRIVGSWDDQLFGNEDWRRAGHAFVEVIHAGTERVRDDLDRPLERAHLLGPKSVEEAVGALQNAFEVLAEQLERLANKEERASPEDWEEWSGLRLEVVDAARGGLVSAAKAALTAPPRPGA